MSHPVPGHDYGENEHHQEFAKKKQKVASKMPYLGDAGPRKGESLSKSMKRFDRYMKSGPKSSFDAKAVAKSARRHRTKEHLPF